MSRTHTLSTPFAAIGVVWLRDALEEFISALGDRNRRSNCRDYLEQI
jgi:hypothetical protein